MADIERIERELREGLDMLSSWPATKPVSDFRIMQKMTIGDLRALLDELTRRAEIIERAISEFRDIAESDSIDNALDPQRNQRIARIFLESLEPTHAE